MELLGLVIGLLALGLLAARFGHDSRDGFSLRSHGSGISAGGRIDPAYDQELATEIQTARQHRLATRRAITLRLPEAIDDVSQAA